MTGMASVMVVDDDDTDRVRRSSRTSSAPGTAPAGSATGRRALDALAEHQPDLMVLDLMLPGIDGLEVCRRVRTGYPDLPVVMLTALAEPDDRIAGLEVGADDYVTKPFSPRELVLRVDSVLRRSTAPRRPDRKTPRRRVDHRRHRRPPRDPRRRRAGADRPRAGPAELPAWRTRGRRSPASS